MKFQLHPKVVVAKLKEFLDSRVTKPRHFILTQRAKSFLSKKVKKKTIKLTNNK